MDICGWHVGKTASLKANTVRADCGNPQVASARLSIRIFLKRGLDLLHKVLASLLLEDQWRAADSISFEIHCHFNAVSNLDEGNAAIHPVVFTVKGHCSGNLPVARPFARNR